MLSIYSKLGVFRKFLLEFFEKTLVFENKIAYFFSFVIKHFLFLTDLCLESLDLRLRIAQLKVYLLSLLIAWHIRYRVKVFLWPFLRLWPALLGQDPRHSRVLAGDLGQ